MGDRRRIAAYQCGRFAARKALAGRRRAARRRNQCHHRDEYPAPREPQRGRPAHHGRRGARDRPRFRAGARGSDRQRRLKHRRTSRAAARGQNLSGDHVEQALKNFFKPSNLTSLRELALREIARGLNRRREDLETRRREGGRRTLVADRLMVGLSSNPRDSASLLRKASRIAGQLNADWYAVHVETPAESVARIDTRNFVKLLDNINLAGDLGAETVWLKSDDVVRALVEFAREHGVTKIIVGRTSQPFWRRMLGRTVPLRLVAAAPDLDVEIAAVAAPEEES